MRIKDVNLHCPPGQIPTHDSPQGPAPTSCRMPTACRDPAAAHPSALPGGPQLHSVFKYLTLTCLIFSKAKGIKDELLKRLMFLTPPPKSQPGSFVSKTHFTGINFLIKY